MPNPYYHPEQLDLEVVAEHKYSTESYEYDMRVVWRHKPTGVLYTARDSGCSCPTPFDDFTSLDRLDRLFIGEIEDEARRAYTSKSSYTNTAGLDDFLSKVREAWDKRDEVA